MSRSGRGFGMERGRLGGPHPGGGGQVPYLPPGMFLPHMAEGGSHRIVSRYINLCVFSEVGSFQGVVLMCRERWAHFRELY